MITADGTVAGSANEADFKRLAALKAELADLETRYPTVESPTVEFTTTFTVPENQEDLEAYLAQVKQACAAAGNITPKFVDAEGNELTEEGLAALAGKTASISVTLPAGMEITAISEAVTAINNLTPTAKTTITITGADSTQVDAVTNLAADLSKINGEFGASVTLDLKVKKADGTTVDYNDTLESILNENTQLTVENADLTEQVAALEGEKANLTD
jgi:hypothetical protein